MEKREKIFLQTERMVIRDYEKEDLNSHHKLMSDREEMRYLPDIMTHSLEESKKDLDEAIADQENPERKFYFLRMEERETGKLIGEIGYTVLEVTPVGKIVHLGYYSHKKYWGQGYMTEALRRVLQFAFEENHVYRVTTGCNPENAASEKVMKKCGMIKEAYMKEKCWFEGKMCDRVEYRMLKPEWNRLSGHE